MIRIGVISDTHGNFTFASKALATWGKIDCLIHAGDGIHDAYILGKLASCPVFAVSGNTDGVTSPVDEIVELKDLKDEEYVIQRILVIHGYQFSPNGREINLAELAKKRDAQIVVYGHTHKLYQNYHSGVLVFNPGSPFRPRQSERSCGVLEIDAKKISAKHIKIS